MWYLSGAAVLAESEELITNNDSNLQSRMCPLMIHLSHNVTSLPRPLMISPFSIKLHFTCLIKTMVHVEKKQNCSPFVFMNRVISITPCTLACDSQTSRVLGFSFDINDTEAPFRETWTVKSCCFLFRWAQALNHCCYLEGVIMLYVAFCTIMAISRQKEARSRDFALLLSNDFKAALHTVYEQPWWQISYPTEI